MERFRYNDEQEEDGRDKRTTSASSGPSWDGQLEKFPAFSVSLKSYARKKNLYKVMMKGTKPLHMTLQKPQDPDRDWCGHSSPESWDLAPAPRSSTT